MPSLLSDKYFKFEMPHFLFILLQGRGERYFGAVSSRLVARYFVVRPELVLLSVEGQSVRDDRSTGNLGESWEIFTSQITLHMIISLAHYNSVSTLFFVGGSERLVWDQSRVYRYSGKIYHASH